MIRLGLKSEPYWLDLLPGVRLKVRPFGTALFFAAQSAMVRVDTEGETASEVIDALRGVAFIKALARLSIIDWEGIADDKEQAAKGAAVAGGLLALVIAYLLGRRAGKRKSQYVEIRRV